MRVGEDGITFRVSRYLLHVLIEDEEAVRHAVERRRGGGTGSGTSRGGGGGGEERAGHEHRHFRALLTSRPPAADATGPINPTPIPGPRFDLFYVMPATPESISRGTLLFCVCMRLYA